VNGIVKGVEGHYTQKYTKIGGIGEHHLFGTRVPVFATTESLESFEKKMRDSHLNAMFSATLTPVGAGLYKN